MSHHLEPVSLVLFDVGNVLIELRPWRQVFPVEDLPRGVDLERAIEVFRSSAIHSRFELGEATEEEFCAEVRRVFSSKRSDREIRSRYLRLLGRPMDGMEELLRELRSRGFRVAGLSNTTPVHLEALPDFPTVALLERLLASCEMGLAKPSREAFTTALGLLDAEPEATLFVDDIVANVEGARAVGMRAVLFEGAERLRQEFGLDAA